MSLSAASASRAGAGLSSNATRFNWTNTTTRHATADRSLFARDDCHLLVDRKQCASKACSWCHGACAADCSEGHPSAHARRNGSSEAHASADRATPFAWRQHAKVWTSAHCALVDELLEGSLEECKARCLADDRCTSFNFAEERGLGCEMRQCAQGERPSLALPGWVGYASYDNENAPRAVPPELMQVPSLVLRGVLDVLLALLLLLVAHRKRVARRAAAADEGSPILKPLATRSGSGSHLGSGGALLDDGGDDDDPPLLDPVRCISSGQGSFLASTGTPSLTRCEPVL